MQSPLVDLYFRHCEEAFLSRCAAKADVAISKNLPDPPSVDDVN